MTNEFSEIGHCGGKVTFNIEIGADGEQSFQAGYSIKRKRPAPITLVALYALPQGVPLEQIHMGGLGEAWSPPPFPGCYPVLMACDSLGYFGHNCPYCGGYWRSGPWPHVCPYCASSAPPQEFISEAQLRYVRHYCDTLTDALESREEGQVIIDMDVVADAAAGTGPKPDFYVSERSQQHRFHCPACNEFNDILGDYGHCSLCGTRNDLLVFEERKIPSIRGALNAGTRPENCLRDGVASLDGLVSMTVKQLARMVPLSSRRAKRLSRQRFHDMEKASEILGAYFDIDIRAGLTEAEWKDATLKFHRRHVYEHSAGEVDQKYIDDTGDTSVQVKQRIREDRQEIHEFLGTLVRIARNLHAGFHDLFPPIREPIEQHEATQSRMSAGR